MENSIKKNGEKEKLTYKLITPKDTKKTRSPKLKIKNNSTNKKYKESSFFPKKYSLILVDSRKSREDIISKSVNNREKLGPDDLKKGEVKKFEFKKDSKKRSNKKACINRKFVIKNINKIFPSKKKRESSAFNRFKVVGKVSAKLNALIQRLQKNASSRRRHSIQWGNKVIIAPRIKAALEKFIKKKEEKPKIIRFSPQRRKKVNANIKEKSSREEISNGYNNCEEEYKEEYEEEDEEYEEEEEEKNEQKDKKNERNNLKMASKKKREGNNNIKILKDNEKQSKKGDDSKYKENEYNEEDNYTYEFDENGKKKKTVGKKRKNQRQNSKGNNSQESTWEYEEDIDEEEEEYEDGINIEKRSNRNFNENKKNNNNLKRNKKRSIEFSVDKIEKNRKKKNAKEFANNKADNGEEGIVNLKKASIRHKSGKLTTFIKNANKEDSLLSFNSNGKTNEENESEEERKEEDEDEKEKENKYEINNMNKKNSVKSQNPINMIKFNNYLKIENLSNGGNIYASQNKRLKTGNEWVGNVLTISKKFVKNIEFDKFSFKNYPITNFKSKSNGKKDMKEILKYIPSKQIDFTIFNIYNYKTSEELSNDKIFKGKVTPKNIRNKNNKSNINNDNEENDDYNVKFNSCIKKYKKYNRGDDDHSINYKNSITSKNNKKKEKDSKRRNNSVIFKNNNDDDIYGNSKNINNGMAINNSININIDKNNNKKYKNSDVKDKQKYFKNNMNINKDEIFNDFKNDISLKNYNRKNEEKKGDDKAGAADEFANKNFQNLEIVRIPNNAQIVYNSNNFKNNISSKVFNYVNETTDVNSNNFKNTTEVQKYINNNKYDYSKRQSTFKNPTSIKQYSNKDGNSIDIQDIYQKTKTSKNYINNNDNCDDDPFNFKNPISLKKNINKNNNFEDNNNSKNTRPFKRYNKTNVESGDTDYISRIYNNNNKKDIEDSFNSIKPKNNKIPYKNNNNFEIVNQENLVNIKNSAKVIKNINNDIIDEDEKQKRYTTNINSIRRYSNNSNDIGVEGEWERKYIVNNRKVNNNNTINNNNNEASRKHFNSISMTNYSNTIYELGISNIEKLNAELLNENIVNNKELNKRRKRYQSLVLKEDNKEFCDLDVNNRNVGILKNYKNKNNANVKNKNERNSLYLKPVKKSNEGKNNFTKKKNKVNFYIYGIQDKFKNKISGEKEYKVKGDDQKLKKNYKFDDYYRRFVAKNEDEDEDSNSSSNSSYHCNDKNISKKKNLDFYENPKNQLYYELLYNINELYDKETNKSQNDTYKNNIFSDDCNYRDNKENDYIYDNKFKRKEKRVNSVDARNIDGGKNPVNKYFGEETIDNNIDKYDKYLKRKEKRGYTSIEGRILVGKYDFTIIEDNNKDRGRRGRLKYKKAKIKKFKSHRDIYDNKTYTRKKKDYLYLYWYANDKTNQTFIYQDNNKKFKKYKKKSNNNTKYKISENCSIQVTDNEEEKNNKNYKTLSGATYHNQIKKITNNNLNNKTIIYNNNKNKVQKKELFTLNSHSVQKRRRINVITQKNKTSILKLNNSQYKINRKLDFTGQRKTKKTSTKNLQQKITNNNQPKLPKDKKLNSKLQFKEMDSIDTIKSKFKKKLIEIDDKLFDAIHYYNGPIDISCISSQNNYVEAVNELSKKVIKNGFKFIKNDNVYFKFSNGLDSFLVEIVKIRNNMLYYLVLKNQ